MMRCTAALFAAATAAGALFVGRSNWACEHDLRSIFQRVERAALYELRRTNPSGYVVTFHVVPSDPLQMSHSARLLKDALWLYSLDTPDWDQMSITVQCLGITTASGGKVYAYHARRSFNEMPEQERDVLVCVDRSTMLPEKVEVTFRDGKYIDEWSFDASIPVDLLASGKPP